MPYVLVFLLGALVAAGGLTVGYFSLAAFLVKREQHLRACQERLANDASRLAQPSAEVEAKRQACDQAVSDFDNRKIQYADVLNENRSLKQDLFNGWVNLKKTERDHVFILGQQTQMEERASALARAYLKDNVAWISEKLTARNFNTSKTRLLKVVSNVREIGYEVDQQEEARLVECLKAGFEAAVRKEFQREEQARIRAQIQEEERLRRDVDKKIEEAKREQAVLEAALEQALKDAVDQHSAEVEKLRMQLAEAQERAERAVSQAQLTKAGYVYVLSNLGSFGDKIFKIGMTRRLEPMERVKELGDASVPFPFDVHMMISCDDAPALENALHRRFHRFRVNRVNLRREYFRVDFNSILDAVRECEANVEYRVDPEALEYHESVSISDEDADYVEEVMESVMDNGDTYLGEGD